MSSLLNAHMIAAAIHADLPNADIEIEDMRADGTYYSVVVTDPAFAGHNLVDQHRMIFTALKDVLTDEMRENGYALSLKTRPLRPL